MKQEQLYLNIINNLCDGVYFVDTDRRITFWNKAAENITGYLQAQIVGNICQNNLLNHIDEQGKPLCIVGCPLYDTLVDGKQHKANVFLRHRDGHRIPVFVNIFPIYENDVIIGAVEIFTPNAPTVYEDDLIEKLSDMAMNDQLTGIANRCKTESYLSYRLNDLQRFGREFCVVFMDIDNFRQFNTTYGHIVGDLVLKSVTKSISHSIRAHDLFGRWGGEEFVGVFEIKNKREVPLLAEKIRVLVECTQIPYQREHLSVTASLGVSIARADDTIESLVERADTLMYQSKANGKNCVTTDID